MSGNDKGLTKIALPSGHTAGGNHRSASTAVKGAGNALRGESSSGPDGDSISETNAGDSDLDALLRRDWDVAGLSTPEVASIIHRLRQALRRALTEKGFAMQRLAQERKALMGSVSQLRASMRAIQSRISSGDPSPDAPTTAVDAAKSIAAHSAGVGSSGGARNLA